MLKEIGYMYENDKVYSLENQANKDHNYIREGYSVLENKFIRVKEIQKVYTEGKYKIGVDIQPGEYYFWGYKVCAEVKGKEKYDIYGGFDECEDLYAMVDGKGSVTIEHGYMTHIDNIIYTYDVKDKLVPKHVYRVGIEIPYGKYYLKYENQYDDGTEIPFLESGECAFDMSEICDFGRKYRERGKEGIAITDELVRYVVMYKGSAILQEKGVFYTDSGPHAFRKQMENYAISKRINDFKKKKLQDVSKIYTGKYVCFYFSIIEPMVEVLMENILSLGEKILLIPNISDEDFARNYVALIDKDNVEKQCIMLYLFMEKKIQCPTSFGISIPNIIHSLQYNNLRGENYEKAVKVLKKEVSEDIIEILKFYSKIYPYRVIDTADYYEKYIPTNDRYRYLYYRVCQNRDEYSKKYTRILIQLAEKGIISKRWRTEFDLYLLAKSYYSDAIYQYHDNFLDKQSLDIFIPSVNLGLEYQGIQHYEAIDFFGGNEGFEERQKLDALKRKKCMDKGILLVEWHYGKDVTDDNFIEMLKDNHLTVPEKKIIDIGYTKKESKDFIKEDNEVLFQYDTEGTFVKEFRSIDEAVEQTGINRVNIQRACSGFRNTAGGYQWRKDYAKNLNKNIEPVSKTKNSGGKRAINQYDMNEKFIRAYESIAEASKENEINSKSIRDAANGKQRHAAGFIWKYVDEE